MAKVSLLIRVAPWLFVVLWSTGFVLARLTAGHVEPLTFLSLRFPIAAAVMLGIALVQRAAWPDSQHAFHAAVAGALLHAAYLGPVYWAVAHGLPGGVAALIVGLQPLITAFFAAGLLKETITRWHWAGLVVGLGGIGMVILPKLDLALVGGITPVTSMMAVVGATGISLGTVYQKKFATGLALASGGFWQYVGASLVVGAGALMTEDFGFDGSFQAWFALGWSVIVLSIGAVALLLLLIRHGDVARVSSYIYLVPAVSALMTYVLFGETLTLTQIGGMAVCAAAVMIVNRKAAHPP